MKYTYTNKVNDYVLAENNKFLFIPKRFFLGYILMVIILPLVEISMVIYYRESNDIFIRFMSIFLIIMSILSPIVFIYRAPKVRAKKFTQHYNNLFKKNEHLKEKKVLEIGKDSIKLLFSNGNEFNLKYGEISKVFERHEVIGVYTNNYDIFTVIPCSIFKTKEDKDVFINRIKQK